MNSDRFETRAILVGREPDPATGAVVVPFYQTSTFAQQEVGEHTRYDSVRVTRGSLLAARDL
jgi:cystathionine beta-lyase/cystathionine gamma-synthase